MRIRSAGWIPYCIAPLDEQIVGPSTGFPVVVPLDSLANPTIPSLMKWARRVRKWEITVSSTAHSDVTFTLENSGEVDESDRICFVPAMLGQAVVTGTTTTAQIEFRPQSPYLDIGALEDGDDYYPAMAVNVTISGAGPTLAVSSIFSFLSDYTFTGSVDGVAIEFGGNEDPIFPGDQITNITVNPLEFFAFAEPGDTEPILATSTGGILLPPFDYPPTYP